MIFLSAQVSAQGSFYDFPLERDSLNLINFRRLKSWGKYDGKGEKNGHWIEYDLLVDTARTTDASIVGATSSYDLRLNAPKSSTLQKAEGIYQQGKRSGLWTWWNAHYWNDSLGWEIKHETQYKRGIKNGRDIEYNLGEVLYQYNYLNGRLNGTSYVNQPPNYIFSCIYKRGIPKRTTYFYETGEIRASMDYKRYPITRVTEFYKNGRIKARYCLLGEDAVLDGEYEEFDENGNLVTRTKFRKGDEMKK